MRQELPDMIALAERMLGSGVGGTLATLFSARGSTYRTLGSMMVSLPGMHAGGVSGGCLEEYVTRQGQIATQDRPAALLQFSTDPDGEGDVPVLGCGGAIEILVERLTSHHLGLLKEVAAAHDRDEPSLLACTVERPRTGISVAREWLSADPGGVTTELERICRDVARERRSGHAALGTATDVLVQYMPALTRLVLFGAGDDAQPLCDVGRSLGWHVTVADRRARLATVARFPNADLVLAADWDEAVDTLRLTSRTAAVLLTHSLEDDARIVSLLARRPLPYVGVLGPAHRRQWLIEEATTQGMQPEDVVAMNLRGPIGLDLGDRSAAGIAVAVAAEILAWLNHRDARPLDSKAPAYGRPSTPGRMPVVGRRPISRV
jgi:xanthine dehydrogenase accessory factor